MKDISDLTQFPECFDGRVKTLHPNVEGGILAIRDNEKHKQQMAELGIEPIDMVVCNLYPFKETILKTGVSHEEIIENIDIGGPTMIQGGSEELSFRDGDYRSGRLHKSNRGNSSSWRYFT